MDDRLCVVQKWSPEKAVMHQAILDPIDRLRIHPSAVGQSVVFEVAPSRGLQASEYDAEAGWQFVRYVRDEEASVSRLDAEWRAGPQRYDSVENNCEHFVSYIEIGRRQSAQLRGVLTALASIAIGAAVASSSARS